jgi:hypothetical protein
MAGGRAGVNNPGANAIDHCVTAITPIEAAVQPYYWIERELLALEGQGHDHRICGCWSGYSLVSSVL